MSKKILITGITGQDGSYLAEKALLEGLETHGIVRRASTLNTERIDHIFNNKKLHLHFGDLTDGTNISKIIRDIKPDYIINSGAQSHVKVSFEVPEYSANTDGIGVLRLLDAITTHCPSCRFLQCSTSEMFGKVQETPQTEKTPFYPRSPYAVSKLFGYWITINYREAYNIFASNSITYNHESPRRGKTFVTRKITQAVANIYHKKQEKLYLGNLKAKRDWAHALDMVDGIWKILMHTSSDDFILATGEVHSVEEFCTLAFEIAGIPIEFSGKGTNRKGIDKHGKVRVEIDPKYFRPTEVDFLQGDASKAKKVLGWAPKIYFEELVKIMVEADLRNA